MTRDDDPTREDIKATIALVRGGVAEEHASGGGAGNKLVSGRGREIRIAEATGNTEMIVRWRLIVQTLKGNSMCNSRRGPPI